MRLDSKPNSWYKQKYFLLLVIFWFKCFFLPFVLLLKDNSVTNGVKSVKMLHLNLNNVYSGSFWFGAWWVIMLFCFCSRQQSPYSLHKTLEAVWKKNSCRFWRRRRGWWRLHWRRRKSPPVWGTNHGEGCDVAGLPHQ